MIKAYCRKSLRKRAKVRIESRLKGWRKGGNEKGDGEGNRVELRVGNEEKKKKLYESKELMGRIRERGKPSQNEGEQMNQESREETIEIFSAENVQMSSNA